MNKSPWYQEYFKDKHITMMGLGLLGRGIGDAQFLLEMGAHLHITDLKTEDQLRVALKQLPQSMRITYTLGKHLVKDFTSADIVVKAAGVPLDSLHIARAKEKKIPIKMSAAWLVELIRDSGMNVTCIGVTGSKGKSTVTGMIESVLKASGKRYHVAGNVRGAANLPLLKKIKDGDVVLLELDSWQLQGFGDQHVSPGIAVFTNFFPDHMNYYKGSMKKYFKDKANIFRYQRSEDMCFAASQVKTAIKEYGRSSDSEKVLTARVANLPSWKFQAIGEHNRYNLSLAYEVGKWLSFSQATIKSGLTSFTAVPGRLEYLGLFDGVHVYNDNNSTTPESTVASLIAIDEKYPNANIVWIGGGSDKGAQYETMARVVSKRVAHSILLDGQGSENIISSLPHSYVDYVIADSMKAAIAITEKTLSKGDVLVLSPAAASFGMFVNEYQRSDQFVKMVKRLKRI